MEPAENSLGVREVRPNQMPTVYILTYRVRLKTRLSISCVANPRPESGEQERPGLQSAGVCSQSWGGRVKCEIGEQAPHLVMVITVAWIPSQATAFVLRLRA